MKNQLTLIFFSLKSLLVHIYFFVPKHRNLGLSDEIYDCQMIFSGTKVCISSVKDSPLLVIILSSNHNISQNSLRLMLSPGLYPWQFPNLYEFYLFLPEMSALYFGVPVTRSMILTDVVGSFVTTNLILRILIPLFRKNWFF